MSRSTIQRITNLKLQQEEWKNKCISVDQSINQHLGNPLNHIILSEMPDHFYIEHDADEHQAIVEAMHDNNINNVHGQINYTPDSVDP